MTEKMSYQDYLQSQKDSLLDKLQKTKDAGDKEMECGSRGVLHGLHRYFKIYIESRNHGKTRSDHRLGRFSEPDYTYRFLTETRLLLRSGLLTFFRVSAISMIPDKWLQVLRKLSRNFNFPFPRHFDTIIRAAPFV